MADKMLDRLSEFERVVNDAAQQVCDVATRVCHTIDQSNGHLKKALQPDLYAQQKPASH